MRHLVANVLGFWKPGIPPSCLEERPARALDERRPSPEGSGGLQRFGTGSRERRPPWLGSSQGSSFWAPPGLEEETPALQRLRPRLAGQSHFQGSAWALVLLPELGSPTPSAGEAQVGGSRGGLKQQQNKLESSQAPRPAFCARSPSSDVMKQKSPAIA